MDLIQLTIDDQIVTVGRETTILQAARQAGIYIPTLCHHPDLPPADTCQPAETIYQGKQELQNVTPDQRAKGCGLCVVEVSGNEELVRSCSTRAIQGMIVNTNGERVQLQRQENLVPILARHRHACLTCAQQEGCSRSQCSGNVPENERCCPQLGHCELQEVANYVGISDRTPKWQATCLPILNSDPLFVRDYNLCIGCTRCIRACSDLRGIGAIGYIHDQLGRIQVGTLHPDLAGSGCKFCTACVEVCPTGALTDKAVRSGKKEEDIVPCRAACPVQVDIPGYLRLVAQGREREALNVIREKTPFPGILGRICIHPCESVCRRGELNEPVAICALKRYAADYSDENSWKNIVINSNTGKKVAVVGAGPAGLTTAFYLRKQGHGVTVFDACSQAGGMMRYGIPTFRLPVDVLDREIQMIWQMGVEFKSNWRLGADFALNDLKAQGFDAVFLGVGAQCSRHIPLEGSDQPDVLWGIDFLRDIANGRKYQFNGKVVVIGGGNVAVDVAMTARRCGAKKVSLACLESTEEMPASASELASAAAEGITVLSCLGPKKIHRQNGRIIALDMVTCVSVYDEKGRFCPRFDEKNKSSLPVDDIILAVGQAADLSFLSESLLIRSDNGMIIVDENMATGMDGVFAGGDAVQAPGAVIHAICAGRKAAVAIDKALGGKGEIDEMMGPRPEANPVLGKENGFVDTLRMKISVIPVESRIKTFQEIEKGYSPVQARKEASRCLQCDLRLTLSANPCPPRNWMPFETVNLEKAPTSEGVYQLLDEKHNILMIKGTDNLRRDLIQLAADGHPAVFWEFEADKFYSKRESELIQRFLQKHGRMPGSDDDNDDLF